MKVENLTNNNGNKVANQFVIRTKQGIFFQSYDSVIALYDDTNDVLTFGVDYDYSRTTLRHLRTFIETYLPKKYHYETTKDLRKMVENKEIVALDKNLNSYF